MQKQKLKIWIKQLSLSEKHVFVKHWCSWWQQSLFKAKNYILIGEQSQLDLNCFLQFYEAYEYASWFSRLSGRMNILLYWIVVIRQVRLGYVRLLFYAVSATMAI